ADGAARTGGGSTCAARWSPAQHRRPARRRRISDIAGPARLHPRRASPLLAERGHWSNTALRHADPVAAPVAVLALILLAVLTVRVITATTRRLFALRDAYRLAAALPAPAGELAVIDHPDRHAFAVPGRPG